MGYWEEKENYEKGKKLRTKCPVNKNVEIIWKSNGLENVCSFSGRSNCKKCIAKGDYPKKNYSKGNYKGEDLGLTEKFDLAGKMKDFSSSVVNTLFSTKPKKR